jgi:hypothetical protein
VRGTRVALASRMMRESRALPSVIPAPHVSRWLIAAPLVFVAVLLLARLAVGEVTRWLASPLPMVEDIDVYAALIDVTPVALTITAGPERIPLVATADTVLTDWTLWRRMHLADWNGIPFPLRANGLDAMLARYHYLLFAPEQWDRMTAHDWDEVPQPMRVLAYRHMVEYWAGSYDRHYAHDLPPRLVSDNAGCNRDVGVVVRPSWSFCQYTGKPRYWACRSIGIRTRASSAAPRARCSRRGAGGP